MTRANTGLCKAGHELTEANTYTAPSTGIRSCRTCNNKRSNAWVKAHGTGKITRDNYYFGGLREVIIQRDGEKCVNCGMTRQEHKERFKGKDITVDHIDGKGHYSPKAEKNNDPSNLQTLCIRCHVQKEAKRRREIDHFERRRDEKGRYLQEVPNDQSE